MARRRGGRYFTTHGSMELLLCQIIYYIVLDSNGFGTVSRRKEGINGRSGTVAANAIRNGRQKQTRRVKKQRLAQGSPTLSAQTAKRAGPLGSVQAERGAAPGTSDLEASEAASEAMMAMY
jgi:hypothetical protein